MESLGFSAVGGSSMMLFWWPNLGFSDSSLVCTCSYMGEAAICVKMSAGLRAPFRGLSFKRCSTVHKQTDHPRRLLVSDLSQDFNKQLCLSHACCGRIVWHMKLPLDSQLSYPFLQCMSSKMGALIILNYLWSAIVAKRCSRPLLVVS